MSLEDTWMGTRAASQTSVLHRTSAEREKDRRTIGRNAKNCVESHERGDCIA